LRAHSLEAGIPSVASEEHPEVLDRLFSRADEGTLSRLLVESSILFAATRGNPAVVLKDAATAYKVNTNAIAAKVKQEFTAKDKARKTAQSTPKAAKREESCVVIPLLRDGSSSPFIVFAVPKNALGEPVPVSPSHAHPPSGPLADCAFGVDSLLLGPAPSVSTISSCMPASLIRHLSHRS
jgi:hypothetical protein